MKIIPKTNSENFPLPLPLYTAVHIADAIAKDGEEFDVYMGMEEKYTAQLKKLSLDKNDTDLQNYTGDRVRFGEGSYPDWYKKNRTTFVLIDKKTDALSAIIWFGPKPPGAKSAKFGKEEAYKIQDMWHTVSFRSYPLFRGKGMMTNFSKFVMDMYQKQFPDVSFWTGTDTRNMVFIKFISGLGFEKSPEFSDLDSNWLVMVKK